MDQVGTGAERTGEQRRDGLAAFARSLEAEVRDLRAQLALQQEALVAGHRLMTLGRLLSDVAHDVANPLTTLVARSAMIRMTTSLEDAQRHAAIVEEQAQRVTRSMRTLSLFGRRAEVGQIPLDLNDVVRTVLELQRHQLTGGNICVVTHLAPRLPHVLGDEQELRQVVLNLVLNAHEAIVAAGENGTVVVSTYTDEETVWLRVRDDGPGMPPEVLDRIFDPFFSTKLDGMGLGLVVARELVMAHGGEISVDTAEGAGTSVTITVPRRLASLPALDAGSAPEAAASRRSLLVVDDESDVGELLSDILRTRGYETQYVTSPRAALELIRDRDFQGVLMDLRMPEMSGTELWRELQRERPALALRTIFMTGDYASPDAVAMIGATAQPFLSKPFRSEQIDLALATLGSTGEHV